MASTAGTFAELLALSTDSENSPITITADIDAYAEGYDIVTDMGGACDIDLNGHTISNVYFQGSGFFVSGANTISDGTLLNIYIDGRAVLRLERVVGSFYLTTSLNLRKIYRCSLDITFSPLASLTQITNDIGYTSTLSNIVVRNAKFVTATANSFYTPKGNFSAIVFENCTFTTPNISNPKTSFVFYISGEHSYLVCHDCTVDSSITDVTLANALSPTYLICIPFLTAPVTGGTEVTEAQLQNREYLEKIGFLP